MVFFHLAGRNCDLSEIEEALFQGFAWPCETIYCLLAGQKLVFVEEDLAMFHGVA
jgi:hypothetical protein